MILPPVLCVLVRSDRDDARRAIVLATADLPAGSLVRLAVGDNLPPVWVVHSMRHDLRYQVVSATPRASRAWQAVLVNQS